MQPAALTRPLNCPVSQELSGVSSCLSLPGAELGHMDTDLGQTDTDLGQTDRHGTHRPGIHRHRPGTHRHRPGTHRHGPGCWGTPWPMSPSSRVSSGGRFFTEESHFLPISGGEGAQEWISLEISAHYIQEATLFHFQSSIYSFLVVTHIDVLLFSPGTAPKCITHPPFYPLVISRSLPQPFKRHLDHL